MLRSLLFAAASAVILSACSTTTESPEPAPEQSTAAKSTFDRAMTTVDDLVGAGNTPIAIERLMQLAGDTSLTEEQKAQTLVLLGDYSLAPTGYNAEGAAAYYQEARAEYPATKAAANAAAKLPAAEARIAELVAVLASVDSTRTQQFDALFNLGRYQDAIDLMVANDLLPGNEELLAMYQIGYLCEDSNLTGRLYQVTDRDGTVRDVRFCDFGK